MRKFLFFLISSIAILSIELNTFGQNLLSGEKIQTLVNENQPDGDYKIDFDANQLSTNIYFYSLEFDGKTYINKMLITK